MCCLIKPQHFVVFHAQFSVISRSLFFILTLYIIHMIGVQIFLFSFFFFQIWHYSYEAKM